MTDVVLDLRGCTECGHMNPSAARFCSRCGSPTQEGELDGEARRADPLIGALVGERYRIVSLLGRGGMGVVYQAEHVRIGKLVALKLLHGELSQNKDIAKRFRREAEIVSMLSHPNTVQIFDFGKSESLMYLVMEYVAGRDLGWIVQNSGPIPFLRAAKIVEQVCASLSEAHSIGLIHRDIKPENVMVIDGTGREFVKVLDFGLAKLRDQEHVNITRAGVLVGTPYYMSPEQIKGESGDVRSDVYSVGALLYKIVSGVPAFSADSPVGVLTKHVSEPLVPPSRRALGGPIPFECDAIVERAMEKDPARRYQNIDELREDLAAYVAGHSEEHGAVRGRVPVASTHRRLLALSAPDAIQIATKEEVDRYEAGLRRRSVLGYFVALVVAAVLALLGVSAWKLRRMAAERDEREPNNEPAQSNRLTRGVPLRAFLGRRIDATLSDADVFRLSTGAAGGKVARIDVSGIPNMDIVVDVVRAGIERPVLRADSAGVGEGELVPNFVFDGGDYFLRIREVWQRGDLPTENVSDPYFVSWDFVEVGPEDEREINDSLETADEVRTGTRVRGYIGWADDEDTYCLAEDARDVRAVVDGVEGLDLVLTSVSRSERIRHAINAAGVGESETSAVLSNGLARDTCFVVSATAEQGGRRANGDAQYVLHFDGQ
jgi:hypothetical protein